MSDSVNKVVLTKDSNSFSFSRLRIVGYGLVILFVIDVFYILIPPQFMNPVWELQIIGTLIERIPVPLLGFALIFLGDYKDRKVIEEFLLKILSWVTLLLALILLLMIPLCLVDTLRVNALGQKQVNVQLQQRLTQLGQLREQVENSKESSFKALVEQLKISNPSIKFQNSEAIKSEFLSRLTSTKEQVQNQAQETQKYQRQTLIKNAVKWSLGALIASTLFFFIWKTTAWARYFQP